MHKLTKKVYYHDTDCGGVVYYANYLKYFEEARTEYMLNKGLDIKKLSQEGTLFVVANVEIDYRKPAHYGDSLLIISEVSKIGNASLEFSQKVQRGDELLVSAKTRLVCVNRDFRPTAMSESIIESLRK